MNTMNISLPEPLREFVEAQVSAGRFATANDYLLQLIREDQTRLSREEIDEKLLEALDGEFTPFTADDWNDIRAEVERRLSPGRRDEMLNS